MGRKNKRHTDRKGKNTFVGDVITYVENPEESTKEPLELINEFSQDTRVNYTKTTHFYILAINNNIRKILEVPFKIARKIIKYFGNFSIHYVQSL